MLDFLKKLGAAVYRTTIGGAVRLYHNTRNSRVDSTDKGFIGRVLTYTGLIIFGVFFPGAAMIIGLLRVMVTYDVIDTIASIFQHTANAYA